MRLTIDNLDGLGAVDYSAAIDRSAPLRIARTLNAPSKLTAIVCLEGASVVGASLESASLESTTLAVPARRARVVATSDAGTLLFTGYLTIAPVPAYAGASSRGDVYRYGLHAVSDEWLLDKQSGALHTGPALNQPAGSLLQTLVQRVDSTRCVTTGLAAGRTAGVLPGTAGGAWSAHAGTLAGATYAGYRALNGSLSLASLPGAVHTLSDRDGSLTPASLKLAPTKEIVNDVTLSGELEPAAYWTELFRGDGTTAAFTLTGDPQGLAQGHARFIDDSFNGTAFDANTWVVNDPAVRLSLGAGGLTLNGGNGFDGATSLAAIDALELGGTFVIELADVMLSVGSDGVVGGLYSGTTTRPHCLAGFNIRQSAGNTLATAYVLGVEVGTSLTLLAGHRYTLRLRVHCAETQRVRQTFYTLVEGSVRSFGGDVVPAGLAVVFEARDAGESSNTPATVLYDGTLTTSPEKAIFAVVDSVQLFGSIGAVRVQHTGTAWITSIDGSTGSTRTRGMGVAGAGVDCSFPSSVTGLVTFYPGREPAPGETVTVRYRSRQRAVARVADAASIAAEAAGGGVGTARFNGHAGKPAARSSVDCENAALAVLSYATTRSAVAAGTYTTTVPGRPDVWPGDLLALTANGSSAQAIVRAVTIDDHGAAPEALAYTMAFANDWAQSLGLHLVATLAADAAVPVVPLVQVGTTAGGGAVSVPTHVLANLPALTVTSITTTAINIDAGCDPPVGSGFEVRRRDGGFGTGGSDLVLRSPVRGFAIPRQAFAERFFVRMVDASSPVLSSRLSSAIATHVAVA